ncbi:hypothetical protein GEMRC1_001663 [Eukaryota sp. GEM-RC1]
MPQSVFFIKPPTDGKARLNVYGQLTSLKRFSRRNLFIQIEMVLPKDCHHHNSSDTSFFTSPVYKSPLCLSTPQSLQCGFQFTYDLELSASLVESLKDATFYQSSQAPPLPLLCFSVVSQDFWGRQRVEGYTWILINPLSSSSSHSLSCWKLHPLTITQQLSELLLGSPVSLIKPSACYPSLFTPKSRCSPVYSSYGMSSKCSGSLELVLSTSLFCSKSLHFELLQAMSPETCLASNMSSGYATLRLESMRTKFKQLTSSTLRQSEPSKIVEQKREVRRESVVEESSSSKPIPRATVKRLEELRNRRSLRKKV